MPVEVDKLMKEIEDKMKELQPHTPDGNMYEGFGNANPFDEQQYLMESRYFSEGSEYTTVEQRPYEGYMYKRGVKLVHDNAKQFESHVELGGANDLYGICVDIERFSKTAQIAPIASLNDKIAMVCKDATIKAGDRIKINDKGEAEKQTGAGNIVGYALMDSKQCIANKLYMVLVQFTGLKNVSA